MAIFGLCLVLWVSNALPPCHNVPSRDSIGASFGGASQKEVYALFGNEAVFFIPRRFHACRRGDAFRAVEQDSFAIMDRFGASPRKLLLPFIS